MANHVQNSPLGSRLKIGRVLVLILVGIALTALRGYTNPGLMFNVKDYGATGNGKTIDSPAINKAIQAAAEAGGGTVFFPAGTYLSGSIHMKSNITLYLDAGCTILGASNDINAYNLPEPNKWDHYQDFGHSHWHNSLIWGEKLNHVAIIGQGTINGGGMTRSNKVPNGGADKSIALKLCNDVDIRDITMAHGGHFAILLTGCDNVTVDNIRIDTDRDGMDIDCCDNVRISNCSVNSPHDDGICLKSSYALGYKKPTENVTITDCMVSGYNEGSMLDGTYAGGGGTGRIKCGTESNGGFQNITISNCVFDHCLGLALEEVDGGKMDGITVTNITMRDCRNSPIFIRLGDRARGPNDPAPGIVKNIQISNVVVVGASSKLASIIAGIPGHDIENVRLSNIRVITNGGGTNAQASIVPPEEIKAYPGPKRFGTIPAYGFYCRHVNGIEFNNIDLSFRHREGRPAFVLDHVNGADFNFITAEKGMDGLPTFQVENAKDFNLANSLGFKPVHRSFTSETRF